MNLVEEKRKHETLPIFGINNVLSYLSGYVKEDKWNELKKACNEKNEKKCKELLKDNIFLTYYSEFENLKKRNQGEAEEYLIRLKVGACFSGMVPGLDIGMEYYYRNLFKQKLKSLYGFDYDEAIKALKENNICDEKEDKIIEKESINNAHSINNQENDKSDDMTNENTKNIINDEAEDLIKKEDNNKNDVGNNKKDEKEKKESEDFEIRNTGKIAGSATRGALEVVGIFLKALPETGSIIARESISSVLRISSWVLFPIFCIGFSAWSWAKVDSDCKKILRTFEKALDFLIFNTLYKYVDSIEESIKHLKTIGEKLEKIDKKQEDKKQENEKKNDEKKKD